MNMDRIAAEAVAQAIREGRISAAPDGTGACHILVRHRLTCPAYVSRGTADCNCGRALRLDLHDGESRDCHICLERGHEH
jgi:hypothetical protein